MASLSSAASSAASSSSSATSLLNEYGDKPLVVPGDWPGMSEFDRRKHALTNDWTTGDWLQAESLLGPDARKKAKALCDRIESSKKDEQRKAPDANAKDVPNTKRRILSFDLGERNLAYTVWDPDRGFVEFTLRDISGWTKRNRKNKKVKADPVDVVMRLEKEGVLNKAGTILVERQMKSRFKCMQVALKTLRYENCVVVAPQSVKKHFASGSGGGAGAHYKNKKKAVQLAKSLLTPRETSLMLAHRKLDDLADCVLQTVWWVRQDSDPDYRAPKNEL